MLSPGTLWQAKLRLKDMRQALAWRDWWRQRGKENARVRTRLLDECAHDLLLYANLFVWTYDPRRDQKAPWLRHQREIPFISYPFQDKALLKILESIERGRDLVIQKSRDMGASWMSLIVMQWLWRFHRGTSFLMMSRVQDLVDKKGDLDALFPKIDFLHEHMPEWVLPKRWERLKNHFGNLDKNSSMDGEATTSASGVGGRRTAVFLDEFSRMENAADIMAGTADVSRCRIFNYTPWGAANAAYKLAQQADQGTIAGLKLHWTEHPEKARGLYRYQDKLELFDDFRGVVYDYKDNPIQYPDEYPFIRDGKKRSPAYDYEEIGRGRTKREMAMMWDINYESSTYNFFDTAAILRLIEEYAEPPRWQGDILYDGDSGKPLRLIPNESGPLRIWCQLDGNNKPPLAPYGAGADISAGEGATNSCLSVMNRTTGEKVAEYTNPWVDPKKFANLSVALCRLFRDKDDAGAKFAWERQGPGVTYGRRVIELGYRNIYYKTNEARMYGGEDPEIPGWFPSNDNKRSLLEEYRSALMARECLNRSKEALDECNKFIFTERGTVEHSQEAAGFNEKTGERDPSGARENHGDRVIADALAWKMVRESGGESVVAKKTEPEPPVLSLAWRRKYNSQKAKQEEAWI